MAGRPRMCVGGALPHTCVFARDRTRNRGGGSSGGRKTPGEHRRAISAWPGSRSLRNGLPGGAKLRSGRAGRSRRAQRRQEADGTCDSLRCVEATGLATAGNLRPGSCVPGPPQGGHVRQRAGAVQVKAVVKILQALRRRRSESEPARKQRPARAGAAPREGKALEGRSRDASGHLLSGESPGGDETARRRGPRRPAGSKDLERAASLLKPSRGARTPRTAPTGIWRSSSLTADRKEDREEKGTRRSCVQGARTSREADPVVPEGRKSSEGRAGGGKVPRTLERTQPHEGSSRARAVQRKLTGMARDEGPTRNTPRSWKRRGGSAGSRQSATRRALSNP